VNAAYPIGFIGLGTMGEAMALTLLKAGYTGGRYVSSALFGFD